MPKLAANPADTQFAECERVIPTPRHRLFCPPATAQLLRGAPTEGSLDKDVFLWTGPATVGAIAASTPMLFSRGR